MVIAGGMGAFVCVAQVQSFANMVSSMQMPTFGDYLTSPAWWTTTVIGGVLTMFVARIFRKATRKLIRYLTARSESRNRVFLRKVAHVSSSPARFTLVAARWSSLDAAVPIYQAVALSLVFLTNILPPTVSTYCAFVGFLFMVGGIRSQVSADYMFSILMTALEKLESADPSIAATISSVK